MICMFPNFAACLELNHSCNEERKERNEEVCVCGQTRRSCHQVLLPTISVNSPRLASCRWPKSKLLQTVGGSQCHALTFHAVYSPHQLGSCYSLLWRCYQWHRNPIPVRDGNFLQYEAFSRVLGSQHYQCVQQQVQSFIQPWRLCVSHLWGVVQRRDTPRLQTQPATRPALIIMSKRWKHQLLETENKATHLVVAWQLPAWICNSDLERNISLS